MNRYKVTIARDFIIYAETEEQAKSKATNSFTDSYATSVSRLPPVIEEGHGPEIDRAPERETRK
jgi:hypothetical protein